MVKLYYPPQALLASGTKDFVEIAGAKCILAVDENRQFIVVSDLWREVSWGEFWKEAKISDQIEKITIKDDDSEAIYNPTVMRERIIAAFKKIIEKKWIFFGIASFEGNAFEKCGFDEVTLSPEDTENLIHIHKFRRLKNAFPNVRQGSWVDVNFFGEANMYFSLPNKKNMRDIASMIYSYEGNSAGIVCTAQGAANFIILTENITKIKTKKNTQLDRKNLDQMFHLIKHNILTPISWFRIDLGMKALDSLENWDEIRNDDQIQKKLNQYYDYIRQIVSEQQEMDYERILDEDLGQPIDIRHINSTQISEDLENLMETINRLNEMEISDQAQSLLFYPPNILLASADKTGTTIGGAMGLLSTDVGKNLIISAELRKYLSWGEYYQDQDPNGTDTFDTFKNQEFFEIQNAGQLKDIYVKAFQKIIQNSHIFMGMLELESNAFELSLFPEIDIQSRDLKRLQDLFKKKRSKSFPKLSEGHINLTWSGIGKEYFSNEDCFGILDIAEKIQTKPMYKKGFGAGIVCTDSKSAYFYILVSNFEQSFSGSVDPGTLMQMFQAIETSDIVPLCWFKITLGMESLKMHPLWRTAFQYTDLLMVLDNYRKYMEGMLISKKKEDQHRIY